MLHNISPFDESLFPFLTKLKQLLRVADNENSLNSRVLVSYETRMPGPSSALELIIVLSDLTENAEADTPTKNSREVEFLNLIVFNFQW